MWAFVAHTQLSLAFLHSILQKLLIIKLMDFAKGAIRIGNFKLWQSVTIKKRIKHFCLILFFYFMCTSVNLLLH